MAGGLLSDMGASVMMLEPQRGVDIRANPAFQVWSRGKESLAASDPCVELAHIAGVHDVLLVDDAIWRQAGEPQAARVTAVIGSDLPGMAADVPASVAPSLADCHSGFARTQQGLRTGPFFLTEPASPFGTSILADIGVLAALYANRPGESETIHVSHLAGSLAMMMFSAVAQQELGAVLDDFLDGDPKRLTFPLLRFFRAADEWIVVGAVSGGGWVNLCLALDRVDLLADPRFKGAPFDIPNPADRIELVDAVQEAIGKRNALEWLEHFREGGVITGPVLLPPLALENEQVRAVGMRAEVTDPALGRLVEPGHPITIIGAQRTKYQPAPPTGAHDPDRLAGLISQVTAERAKPRRSAPPLQDLRVLDFASVAAGPGISRLLAGMGAEVIKVEPPGGDHIRAVAFTFISVNAGKRSVTARLSADQPTPELDDLLKGCDIVIHNFRRSTAVKVGLTSERLAALNPNIIEIMVSGYGSDGPDADLPSIDPVFEALSGGSLVQGGGDEPFGYTGGPNDNGTSLLGALAAIAALNRRRVNPGSQHLGVSLLGTALYRHAEILVEPISDWKKVTLGPDPLGPTPGHRLYRTNDGWMLLAVTKPEEWERLRTLDRRIPASMSLNPQEEEAARADMVLEVLIEDRTLGEMLEWCHAHGIPVAPANGLRDCLLDLQESGSRLVRQFDDVDFGRLISLHELIAFAGPGWKDLGSAPSLDAVSLADVRWDPRSS